MCYCEVFTTLLALVNGNWGWSWNPRFKSTDCCGASFFFERLPAGPCSDDPGFKTPGTLFASSGVTNKITSSASAFWLSSATLNMKFKLLLANHSILISLTLTVTFQVHFCVGLSCWSCVLVWGLADSRSRWIWRPSCTGIESGVTIMAAWMGSVYICLIQRVCLFRYHYYWALISCSFHDLGQKLLRRYFQFPMRGCKKFVLYI